MLQFSENSIWALSNSQDEGTEICFDFFFLQQIITIIHIFKMCFLFAYSTVKSADVI